MREKAPTHILSNSSSGISLDHIKQLQNEYTGVLHSNSIFSSKNRAVMDNYNSDIIERIKVRQKQNEVNEIEASNLKSLQELNEAKREKADSAMYCLVPNKHQPNKQPW